MGQFIRTLVVLHFACGAAIAFAQSIVDADSGYNHYVESIAARAGKELEPLRKLPLANNVVANSPDFMLQLFATEGSATFRKALIDSFGVRGGRDRSLLCAAAISSIRGADWKPIADRVDIKRCALKSAELGLPESVICLSDAEVKVRLAEFDLWLLRQKRKPTSVGRWCAE